MHLESPHATNSRILGTYPNAIVDPVRIPKLYQSTRLLFPFGHSRTCMYGDVSSVMGSTYAQPKHHRAHTTALLLFLCVA